MGAKQLLKGLSKIKVPKLTLKSAMSSITHEQQAVFNSLKNIKISTNTQVQKFKESQLFKQHSNGKPVKLDFHEDKTHKGHTLSKHVSKGSLEKDIKFMVDRRFSEDLKIVSMYPSKEIAEKVTNEVLLHNEKKIAKWFNSPKRKIGEERPFSKGFDFNVPPRGYKIPRLLGEGKI